jgi:alpha-ketoglutarate-dependent taurine dioxygenase
MALNTFKGVKPKPLKLSAEALVRTELLPGTGAPLVLRPDACDLSLAEWAQDKRQFIDEELGRYGGLLFRGFNLSTVERFERFMRAISADTIEYGERSSPRTRVGDGVYTSTDHPADEPILLHNEQSYTLNWPMKICFFCVTPAPERGRTPIADSRRVLDRLSPSMKETFARKQVTYVRNYGEGLGLPWQEVFQTGDRAVVERHCRQAQIEWEWKDRNRLRTRQTRPAVRRHPRTGELVWFNHALFFHYTSLRASTLESLLSVVTEDEMPFNTFYGEGSPIEPSVLAELREVYEQETVSFDWQEQDVLLLDNMLMAHGREPFSGPRKILVSMAEPFNAAREQ